MRGHKNKVTAFAAECLRRTGLDFAFGGEFDFVFPPPGPSTLVPTGRIFSEAGAFVCAFLVPGAAPKGSWTASLVPFRSSGVETRTPGLDLAG